MHTKFSIHGPDAVQYVWKFKFSMLVLSLPCMATVVIDK
eukprot:SAG31_NODE_28923_length_403_cov_1.148026_1_plen_38_part_10